MRVGAGIEELGSLKQRFDREQANVSSLKQGLDSELGSIYWEGPAATRFREAWNGEFRPMLERLAVSLGEASVEIESRRQRLEAAGS